jgi:hypothetical protein
MFNLLISCLGCVDRLIRKLLGFSRQRCDKIRLPGLSTVVRERLFLVMGIGCDVGPDKSHQDGPSIELVLFEKLSAPVFELSMSGWLRVPLSM